MLKEEKTEENLSRIKAEPVNDIGIKNLIEQYIKNNPNSKKELPDIEL